MSSNLTSATLNLWSLEMALGMLALSAILSLFWALRPARETPEIPKKVSKPRERMPMEATETRCATIRILKVGDLVRLTRDEAGLLITAYAGDWGRIERISKRNTLDIRLSGYSRPTGSMMSSVTDYPASHVVACDARGVAVDERVWDRWEERRAAAKRANWF